ncbi:Uncharacterized protein BP5553_00792 [Venustampulla echinocandica]|uniref:DnaJ homologue subfamily C member 28 conserved domain-containing protein n=1 Tax=Venustampulla echinocandica TaxID=2656787 RepID=A0A370TZ52_9HELO|nr:Uncharacterized protein BP5553_00792 [Venustampulla echinocandica]RDL40813.1 Uncharacterized protein BP5553_00792 [Venustampulla echinocandica]
MPNLRYYSPHICARCLRTVQRHNGYPRSQFASRSFSHLSPLRVSSKIAEQERHSIEAEPSEKYPTPESSTSPQSNHGQKQGAMSRRLAQATEDALLEGGRAGRKAVEEAGFSDELKDQLLERVQAHKFREENLTAFTEAGLTSNVGKGSRDIATAQTWAGDEAPEDTMLRMVDDARKPLKPGLRGPTQIPDPVVDLRFKRTPKQRPGQRIANAKDKTSIYATSKDTQLSDKERAALRQELKERFMPAARAMPNSPGGLAALANERIEDAIARGQFKDIPRGKAIKRDPGADNPFVDTTEYLMNRMIQQQAIVPPWIEKQQEIVKTASTLRARLRYEWKRHAARTIASRGGTLEDQMRQADIYAEAERLHNPRRQDVEKIALGGNATASPVIVKIAQQPTSPSASDPPSIQVPVETKDVEIAVSESPGASTGETPKAQPQPSRPLPAPFRLPEWEAGEQSYLQLAITNLNSLTRSYNLMAPELAKKPYFSLERELRNCYADVAPQLAQEIRERATQPRARDVTGSYKPAGGGALETFSQGKAKVYDDKKPMPLAPPGKFSDEWVAARARPGCDPGTANSGLVEHTCDNAGNSSNSSNSSSSSNSPPTQLQLCKLCNRINPGSARSPSHQA